MKKLLTIFLFISFTCHSQKWTKIALGNGDTMIVQVVKNGMQRDTAMGMIPNVASNMANYTPTASLPNMGLYSLATHNHTGVYQPVGSYLVAADIAGKLNTNGSAALLTNFPTLNQNTSGTAGGLSTPLSFTNGGQTGTAATATTGTIPLTIATSILTVTPSAAITYTSTTAVTGQRISFIITTSGTSSFIITFGSGFKAVSTLATGTVTAKTFVVSFIGSANTYIETSRTVAQ